MPASSIDLKYLSIYDLDVVRIWRQHMANKRFSPGLFVAIIFGMLLSACAPAVPPLDDSLVKPYSDELDKQQQIAQAVALNDPELREAVVDPASSEALRSEVFGVYPARPSDLSQGNTGCEGKDCYRVDVRNRARA